MTRWAKDRGYALTPEGTPAFFMGQLSYYGAELQLRCISTLAANTTFLNIAGTEAQMNLIDAVYAEMIRRFGTYSAYPSAVTPADTGWSAPGPFYQLGYMTFELPFGDYQLWENGTVPDRIARALSRAGTAVIVQKRQGFTFFTANEPGSSVTLRSPVTGDYRVPAADGSWQPHADVLGGGAPTTSANVRTTVLVGVAGQIFGQGNADSAASRYLGDDAAGRLARIPGAVDGGKLDLLIQNW